MRKFLSAALAGALVASSFAPAAFAQSGYETGAGKPSGTTTNSGEARPDANRGSTGSGETMPGTRAAPTSGSEGSGSGMSRPDASSASSSGAPNASSNTPTAKPASPAGN